jgi:thiopeptide-type bacteriocin biosynthesis protein
VPALALAAANHAALLDGLGVPDWPRWVRAGYPMKHHDVFRRHRQLAVRLIDPADPGAALLAIPGAESLTDSWLRRQAAAARYGEVLRALGGVALVRECAGSVLHMHANRLLGVDREAEEQSYSLLHGVARAHLGRAAAAASARR